MPHRGSISKIFAAGILCAWTLAPRDAAARDDEATILRAALDRMYRMDYPAAEKLLAEDSASPSAARLYFSGVVCLNRFLDWGDTAALHRAQSRWQRLSPRGEPSPQLRGEDPERLRLYRGLAGFQLAYVASLRGQTLRSATIALAARDRLLSPTPHNSPEARASLMLYDHYRHRILERLPFFDTVEFPVAAFERAAATTVTREMLLFSLFWIHVDARRFEPAAAIADAFLDRYPENRLAREMRGSLLFRSGDPARARAEYEKLREEYADISKTPDRLPVGYYRAVGNLARIRAAQGEEREAEALRAEWKRGLREPAGPWLPSGLKADLVKPAKPDLARP